MNITTPSGIIGIIDEADEFIVSKNKWYAHKTGTKIYIRGYKKGDRKSGLVYLHHVIKKPKKDLEIDHINGDGTDNRSENLRFVNRTENNANRMGVKGCYYEQKTGKWRATVCKNNIKYRLGRYTTEAEAVMAYTVKKNELYPNLSLIGN